MKMEGNNRPPLSERLPFRKPDRDVWLGIESELNHPTTPLGRKLPAHQPDADLWQKISGNLSATPLHRKNILVKSILAVLLLLLLFLSWMYFPENQYMEDTFSDKAKKSAGSVNPETIGSTLQNPNEAVSEEISSIEITLNQKLTENNKKGVSTAVPSAKSAALNDFGHHLAEEPQLKMVMEEQPGVDQFPTSANPGSETSGFIVLNPIFPNNLNLNSKKLNPSKRGSFSKYPISKNVHWEVGGYFQTSWIQNISSINNNWYYKPELGISVGVRSKRFLFETGMSVSRFSFEDRIELEYFEAVFLGTLITADKWVLEEYFDEDGMPQTRQKFIVELIDIYDTTFVEQAKDDRVRLSVAAVPLTFGYRFGDNGKMFYDLKTGIDLMIIDGDVIPGNWHTLVMAEQIEFHHSFVEKYSLKWKYRLALEIGYRTNERMSVYAAPSVWWFPDGIQQKESDTFKNPFETGLRIGVKWEL